MISILNSNNAPISKDFRWPTTSRHISSSFGYRLHPIFKVTKFHSGIDITAHIGEEVYASKDGTVVFSGWNGGYGNCIVVDHGNGVSTLYAHLSAMSVSKNIKVSKGNVIGKIGSTGCSSGPHLHFEILVNGTAKNPLSYL